MVNNARHVLEIYRLGRKVSDDEHHSVVDVESPGVIHHVGIHLEYARPPTVSVIDRYVETERFADFGK